MTPSEQNAAARASHGLIPIRPARNRRSVRLVRCGRSDAHTWRYGVIHRTRGGGAYGKLSG